MRLLPASGQPACSDTHPQPAGTGLERRRQLFVAGGVWCGRLHARHRHHTDRNCPGIDADGTGLGTLVRRVCYRHLRQRDQHSPLRPFRHPLRREHLRHGFLCARLQLEWLARQRYRGLSARQPDGVPDPQQRVYGLSVCAALPRQRDARVASGKRGL